MEKDYLLTDVDVKLISQAKENLSKCLRNINLKDATKYPDATIQTQGINNIWLNCEHKDWLDLINDGWVFVGLNQDSHAMMKRNNYLNLFRNKA